MTSLPERSETRASLRCPLLGRSLQPGGLPYNSVQLQLSNNLNIKWIAGLVASFLRGPSLEPGPGDSQSRSFTTAPRIQYYEYAWLNLQISTV